MNIKSNHYRLSIAAVLAAGVISVAACGTASEEVRSAGPAAAAAPAVAEVYGSSRQLERQAAEARAIDASGSDRHLELRAAEIAAQQAEVYGADRHLELRAAELASQQAKVVGAEDASQRHLELKPAAPVFHWTGPR